MKITSVNNDLIKDTAKLLKSKYRDETGLFLIEGEKGVEEALETGVEVERIFILESYNNDIANEIKQSRKNISRLLQTSPSSDALIIETTEAILSKISDAKSAPKIIAVAKQTQQDIKLFKEYNKVVLLEGIKDPGNLGTILRTSVAFGFEGVVLYGDTVDLYNPKCVRSAVGNLWKIPVIKISKQEDLKSLFDKHERVATLPKGENVINLKKYSPSEKILIMFGSEADGLSEELKSFATKNITIEMKENVESLNLSISVAVIMYKLIG